MKLWISNESSERKCWFSTCDYQPRCFSLEQILVLWQKISEAFGLYNEGLTSVRHRGPVYVVRDSSESLERAIWKALQLRASGKDGGPTGTAGLCSWNLHNWEPKNPLHLIRPFASFPSCHQSITATQLFRDMYSLML